MDERNDYNSIPMQPTQTAVEWLVEQITYKLGIRIENTTDGCELLKQAKQIEKEQIMEAWIVSDNPLQRMAAEQYYNLKYNQNN
jgi:hypothetical protein